VSRTSLHVVVAVKYVPDASLERTFEPGDQTVDRAAGSGRCSELDEYAIEAALSLVAKVGAGAVTAVTIGPPAASDALKKALQMGADAGVHVSDDAIAGSDAPATSRVLAAAVARIGADVPVDLVVCGMASTDGAMSVLPAMLAERLGWPQATLAHEVDLTGTDGSAVTVKRDGETSTQTITAALPAVISVTDQANQPRYPSLKSIMAARKKTVTTWTLGDIGVDPGEVGLAAAWTTVLSATARPPRTAGRRVPDEGNGGSVLVDFLVEQRLV
jgi:electron transfer flavoprotein beta subunit